MIGSKLYDNPQVVLYDRPGGRSRIVTAALVSVLETFAVLRAEGRTLALDLRTGRDRNGGSARLGEATRSLLLRSVSDDGAEPVKPERGYVTGGVRRLGAEGRSVDEIADALGVKRSQVRAVIAASERKRYKGNP